MNSDHFRNLCKVYYRVYQLTLGCVTQHKDLEDLYEIAKLEREEGVLDYMKPL